MAVLEEHVATAKEADLCKKLWKGKVAATLDLDGRICRLQCPEDHLVQVCQWLMRDLGFAFATLVVDEQLTEGWLLTYVFYKAADRLWVYVELQLDADTKTVPSISGLTRGPSADWHEREAEDLFGFTFEGHPRLGEFVLHEDWPEGVNPMRRNFDARRFSGRELNIAWEPPTVTAPLTPSMRFQWLLASRRRISPRCTWSQWRKSLICRKPLKT
jgi:Ni,Fe-hydrogenase III component G